MSKYARSGLWGLFAGTDKIQRMAQAVRNREWGEVTIAAPPALSARFLAFARSAARPFDIEAQAEHA